jgi:hypothetical protein
MNTRALIRDRANAVILATACIALALCLTSCAGGGSTAAVPVSTDSTAGFSVSTTTVTFGNQVVGTTSGPQSATLTNVGNAALSISSIQVTGSNAGDFTLTNNCGSSLAASAQCTLSVTFTPSAAGTRTASVIFTDNAAGSPQTVNLTGTGTAGGVDLSATTLTFGRQLLGTSTPQQSVTLTNNGSAALSITSVAVTGADPGDFPETTTCGNSVAAGGSCTISVTFKPAAIGSRTASISITDNASGSPQMVTLTGTGTNASASLTANSLAFGNQNIGTTTAPQSVTLNNTGNETLSITSTGLAGANPGDFNETTNCGSSLAVGGNCTITVTFTPSAAGSRAASVVITDNASDSPQMITLTGTGVGTAPVAGLSTNSLPFGSQSVSTTSAPLSVTLSNTGNATLDITSVGFSGANATDFATSANTCGSTLGASGTCTISVTFTPGAAGSRSGTLVVTDNSGGVTGSTQNVSLSGTGTSSAVSLSATALTFTNQAVGTTSAAQTVTLTNTGNASLSISGFALTGTNAGDFTQNSNCGSSVAGDGHCTINVTFKPSAAGTRTATVSITDSAAGSPQTISLTGTGGGTAVSLTSTSLVFNTQTLGTTSAIQAVTLSNTGNEALSITGLALTGTNAGDFAQTNTCGSSVAAGGNCVISVTFTPTAPGSRTAAVTITDNSPGSPQAVSLTGTGNGPVVGLSASTLTYTSQSVGSTSGSQTLTLNNTGNTALIITGMPITGADGGDFLETNTCGSSVPAGDNCTISVTFTPTAAGTRTATLTITDNATSSPQTVSLTGTATAPVASLTATSLTFTGQNVGTTSPAQTVTLSNTGTGTLTIASTAVTGIESGDFTRTTTCGSTLAPNGNCTISVTFTPTEPGTRTASLIITDNTNDVTGSTQTVSLTGTGDGPGVSLSPTSLTFGSQNQGTSSPAQVITLTNTGTTNLTGVSIAITGTDSADFTDTTTCGGTVSAGGNCTISVTFTPLANSTLTAAVTITDSAPGSPQSVPLTGSGLSGQVSLSPSSLTFASQGIGTTSAAQTSVLTNTGNASFTINSITLAGANPGDFTATNNCGSSLAQNATCTITVKFTPTALGARAASVSIADSLTSSPQTLALTGTGSGPAVSLSASSLTFTSQNLNTTSAAQSVTLTNTGNASLTITSIGAAGTDPGDFTVTNTCGSSVAVNGNCTISVTFTPAATGTRTASVSIADNAAGSPQLVSLTGTGSAPVAGVTPTSLTFTSQNLGTTSASQTVTLNNTGNAALSISGIAFNGADPGDFAETTTCPSSLAAGDNCTLSVTFKPAASGTRTASLNITDNSNEVTGSVQSVTLTGTGTGPTVSLSSSTLPFGSQTQSTTSAAQSVTLTNTGNASLTITGITVTGTNPSDFALTTTGTSCPYSGGSVGAGGSCTISVTFTPAAMASFNASISIADNALGTPQLVSLTGTGTASVVNLSGVSLTFTSQVLNTTSASQSVTLTNTGNVSLTISLISVTGTNAGDFALTTTGTSCPYSGGSVAASGNCTISVTFTPTASGSRAASVTIADNATAGSPQAVSLVGTGITGSVALSATTLSFGSQSVGTTSTPAQVITLTNGGSTSLTINSIQLTGTNPGDYAIASNTCTSGSPIGVNGTCTVGVTFTPSTSGSRPATLSFADSATNSPQTVSLTGTGTAPEASLSPTSYAFASQPATTSSAAETFTLSNTGNGTLDIASIAFTGTDSGDFSQITTCGTTLGVTTCTIAVTFTPAASGSRSGTLVVTDNSNNVTGSTQTATLTGTGAHDVVLTWTASSTSGVLGYDVYRGTTSGGEGTTPIASEVAASCAPSTTCTYVDSAVTAGTTYYYEVTAVGSNGTTQSTPSAESNAATVP